MEMVDILKVINIGLIKRGNITEKHNGSESSKLGWYRLALIMRRKRNWLHEGSRPFWPTEKYIAG